LRRYKVWMRARSPIWITAALVLAAAALAVYLVVKPGEQPSVNAKYVVDGASVGGKCSDDRPAGKGRPASSPWCTLERAAKKAPPGATVVVRRGRYGRTELTGKGPRVLRLKAYGHEKVTLAGLSVGGRDLRLQGFRVPGGINVNAGARHIALVKNRTTNIQIQAGVSHLLLARNRIAQTARLRTINGINFNSTNTAPAIRSVTIRDNRISPIPGGGDAIQAKHTVGLRVLNNEISWMVSPKGSGAHPDAFQSIYGATDLTIEDNYIHDIAAQGIFLQEFQGQNRGVTVKDNVIARVAYPFVAFTMSATDGVVDHNTIDGVARIGQFTRDSRFVANIATFGLLFDGSPGVQENYNLAKHFTSTRGSRSMIGMPEYRNARGNDFSLVPGSPGYRAAADGRDLGSRRTVFRSG
jgi:hypothetical protein